MKKIIFGIFAFVFSITLFAAVDTANASPAGKGFDEFGYNDTARNFVGTCVSWYNGKYGGTEANAIAYCGPYSNDKLVMKWNAEWDRGNDEGWTDPNGYDAWLDNEWNGKKDGSGEIWHYKIAWDEGCATGANPSMQALKGTAYCIWGPFAMLQSQGTVGNEHMWDVLLAPAGYGAY